MYTPFSDFLYHPCIKQLENNITQMQQFIKNKLKTDVKKIASSFKEKGTYECNLCERIFVHASGLNRHLEKHSRETIPNVRTKSIPTQAITSCLLCGRVFTKALTALKHISDDHNESDNDFLDSNVPANYLEKTSKIDNAIILKPMSTDHYDDISNMAENFKATIVPTLFQCEFCEFMFDNVQHLLNHEVSHDPAYGYECQSCDIKGLSATAIHLHWQTECIFLFNTQNKLIEVEKVFVCNICMESFHSLNLLYTHRYLNNYC